MLSENNSLRIVFAGTPNFAAAHLKALLSSKYKVVGVITKVNVWNGRKKNR